MNLISLSVLCVFTGSFPVQAESPYKGGMNYTAVRRAANTPHVLQQNHEDTAVARNMIRQKNAQPSAQASATEPEIEDNSPASRVWKKYQALATGQADEATPDAASAKTGQASKNVAAPKTIKNSALPSIESINPPLAPSAPLEPAAATPAAGSGLSPDQPQVTDVPRPAQSGAASSSTEPSGLTALIHKYEQNKAQRSQMRTIRAPRPAQQTAPAAPVNN